MYDEKSITAWFTEHDLDPNTGTKLTDRKIMKIPIDIYLNEDKLNDFIKKIRHEYMMIEHLNSAKQHDEE